MTATKIGVFDSGLGGLSVVRELLRMEPNASIIYFADTKHVPYGERSLDQVRDYALGIVDYLISEGVGAILMACNISSAVALRDARSKYPTLPLIGVIEAGARAAAELSQNKIAVLATTGTVRSNGYKYAIACVSPHTEVIQTSCPKFVPFVEQGQLDGAEVEQACYDYLAPGLEAGARVFILGCTHYPFLLPVLKHVAPARTVFIDPARESASEMLTMVQNNLDCHSASRYILSSDSNVFQPIGSRFVGKNLPKLETAHWNEDSLQIEPAVSSLVVI